MILITFNGVCNTNASRHMKRLRIAGRSEKSHVVMYVRNEDVAQLGALGVMRPLVEELEGRMSGSIVPRGVSRRVRKVKNMLVSSWLVLLVSNFWFLLISHWTYTGAGLGSFNPSN
jgi:hypothetical protein